MTGPSIVALTGGVGGAKLCLGLHHELATGDLACVVNTGDDFDHLGLRICPDLDTVLYTLSGRGDRVRGWGRAGESWNALRTVSEFGGPSWFQLGDLDLGLHLERSRRLAAGETLAAIAAHMTRCWSVGSMILPATNDLIATRIVTDAGTIDFQDYFVRLRAEPVVRAVLIHGAEAATVASDVLSALSSARLRTVILCPSNPFLSIDPMLAVGGMRQALRDSGVRIVAVSPLIGGKAVKGPTAKIMAELGMALTPQAIAYHYDGLIDGLVVDTADQALARSSGVPTHVTSTLMRSLDDQRRLAAEVLTFAASLTRA